MVKNKNYYIFIFTQYTFRTNLVLTAKEILFSRTFPGQNYHFPAQSIHNLKVTNQDMYEKHIMFIQCMINY